MFSRACLLLLLATAIFSNPGAARDLSIPVLTLNDSVNVGSAEYILRNLRTAEANKTPALILRMDTPGGLLDSTRDIVQAFLKTPVRVIVWVTPEGARAASAGAMITLASHVAAMSRATSIGAASPVSVGAGGDATDKLSDTMKSKITNDTLAFVEGIARERKRNVDWAKKFVAEAASLTADTAVEVGIADSIASTLAEVWSAARKKYPDLPTEVVFENADPLLKEKALSFISNPNVAYGLLGLGTLGLYVEMTHPGLVVPGTIGAVSLALGAISLRILPIRSGAVVLLFVALVLLAIEFLTALPTYGVAGALGLASLLMSGLFLIDRSQSDLALSPQLWLPAFVFVSLFVVFLGTQSLRALQAKPILQGYNALTGDTGRISKVFEDGKEAMLKVRGELWKVELQNYPEEKLSENDEVEVVTQKGFQIYVRKKGNRNV